LFQLDRVLLKGGRGFILPVLTRVKAIRCSDNPGNFQTSSFWTHPHLLRPQHRFFKIAWNYFDGIVLKKATTKKYELV